MTDTERKRIDAICKVANVKDIGDLSDGFHTFNSLYYQRMILFATLVKTYKDRSWKSLRHEDGELCFGGGWFIVGIDTPEGSYTYHYEAKYFDLFDCDILDYGKHWDGHTEKDVTRLLSLTSAEPLSRCVAKIMINKEDIEELVAEKVEEIKEMLESQSERKKGKWIYGEKSGQDGWYCSECGGFIPWYYDYYGLDNIDFIEDFKTCPFCDSKMVSYTGADMREGEEE